MTFIVILKQPAYTENTLLLMGLYLPHNYYFFKLDSSATIFSGAYREHPFNIQFYESDDSLTNTHSAITSLLHYVIALFCNKKNTVFKKAHFISAIEKP